MNIDRMLKHLNALLHILTRYCFIL